MKHLEKIDILRGIAIIWVFLYHCSSLIPDFDNYHSAGNFRLNNLTDYFVFLSPTSYGWAGVELFFIISGFLIHLIYLNKQQLPIREFYLKRFWRIYPPYLIILLFFCFRTGSITYYLLNPEGIKTFLSHIFLIHNFWPETIFKINPSFWSLAVECQLYLLYPVIIYILRFVQLRYILFCSVVIHIVNQYYPVPFIGTILNYWYVWLFGAYLAECYYKGVRVWGNSNAFIFKILILVSGVYLANYIYTLNIYVHLLMVIALILAIDWYLNSKRNISRFGNIISYIGISSYSIYLTHQPYLNELLNHFNLYENTNKYVIVVNYVFKISVSFGLVYLISYALYKLVESNSITIGKKIIARIQQKAKVNLHRVDD